LADDNSIGDITNNIHQESETEKDDIPMMPSRCADDAPFFVIKFNILHGTQKYNSIHQTQKRDLSWKTKHYIITFCMSHRRCKMYCGHARLCVCLSAAVRPHYCTDPDVTWGCGRGCPLVGHYWADLQSVNRLHCYGNITRTLVYTGCAHVAD